MRSRRDLHAKIEAGNGIMGVRAKCVQDCQQPSEARREEWDGSSSGSPVGITPADVLISYLRMPAL